MFVNDTIQTTTDRFYTLLHWQIANKMFKGDTNLHPYSTGASYAGFHTQKLTDGWRLILSAGVDWTRYAFGYNDDGSTRTPRTELEASNFAILDECIKFTARLINNDIGVYFNGDKLY